MQVSLSNYDAVVHKIYDAALHPDRLQGVLESICALLQGVYGNLYSWTREPDRGGFFFTTFPPGLVGRYLQIMSDDPHMVATQTRGLMREGVAVTNHELVPEKALLGANTLAEAGEAASVVPPDFSTAKSAEQNDPQRFESNANVKLLRAVSYLILNVVPSDPA